MDTKKEIKAELAELTAEIDKLCRRTPPHKRTPEWEKEYKALCKVQTELLKKQRGG